MSTSCFCTIVAHNYLAYARVLAHSLREHHRDARLVVLLVDPPPQSAVAATEPFEVVAASDLDLPGLRTMAFRYSVLELGTALKPTLLRHLHSRFGCDRAVYLDPDILVLSPLDELFDRLEHADLLLTPHITAPIGDDAVPGERELLVSGVYNLGFLGVRFSPEALSFLRWWEERLARDCVHAIEDGLFVDQKWMDLAPALVERVAVLRDPGLNMAYWNLPHRRLDRNAEGAFRVGDQPLRFFHFSGYDLERPDLLSRFQNRYRLSDRPDLAPLFADYAERLETAGHRQQRRLAYGYGCYADGVPIPAAARHLLARVDPGGRRWPDPFQVTGTDAFRAWAEHSGRSAGTTLPRLAMALWESRADLRVRFPEPEGRDRGAFSAWLVAHRASLGLADLVLAELEAASMVRPVGSSGKVAIGEATTTGRAAFLPPLALELVASRRDLRVRFADPEGADRRDLAIWFVTHARAELALPREVWLPTRRSLSIKDAWWTRLWWLRQRARAVDASWKSSRLPEPSAGRPTIAGRAPDPAARREGGVNVVGWASGTTGTAAICRQMIVALEAAGVPGVLFDLDRDAARITGARSDQEGLPFDITLLHANADMTAEALSRLPRSATAGRIHVGYWFWEVAHFPLELASAFALLDEVWAPTRFAAEAFESLSPIPVRHVPPCVPAPQEPPADRAELGVDPRAFLFLFAFDARSVPERKNPLGLLAAFGEACRRAERPLALVLKTQHLDPDSSLAREIRRQVARLPVTVVDASLDMAGMQRLHATADAYVSLHRAEGLGVPLIEAMALGKPVIATGYGGVDDFLDDETGFVIPHRRVCVGAGNAPYPAAAVWADPDLGRASELMLAVAAGGDEVRRRAAAGRERVAALYSPEAAGRRLRAELARLGNDAIERRGQR